jgi:hypothetical protein
MANIYLMKRTCMNDKYPFPSDSGLVQYHDQDYVVSSGSDWRSFYSISSQVIDRLKILSEEGHKIVSGLSPFFLERVVIDEDIEVYTELSRNDKEITRLENFGVNVQFLA